ncbi:uncharacterized protein EV420DRAFT_1559152 [Desarmillaria tabescens]|uniref:Uncharacterized protein n=1 Tax=Armillaria tabescens TaxID=1929756 RepID=A0AA39N007_ARMTA|nr:uncharacterized protein EV420DRAFT_1559152 [Desarmillaria tabescens]KAK0452150.1 hypothetical protein EV420DRAFT_1559152 [Desarmillaria tabescens]
MNSLSNSNMTTLSPPTEKKIRCCFFFSLAFVVVIPIVCIVLGVELHPHDFSNSDQTFPDNTNRTISLHANLISADLTAGQMVLNWIVVDDNCDPQSTDCAEVNIYFDTNLLHLSDTSSSESSNNNEPADPTFTWNLTAAVYEYPFANTPSFQTELAIFPLYDFRNHSIRRTHSSNVYYPFDHYDTEVFAFATDASTNGTVQLHLNSTSGIVEGLKITADVITASDLAQDLLPELIDISVTLQRGTLIILYCIVITLTFWLITLAICLVMIMTIVFGFRQRNEIVVVPVATVFAFVQLRSTMPGAPDGFGDVLDFAGVLPCLVFLSISAVTMVGIYVFTDPAKESREELTWSALVQTLIRLKEATPKKIESMYKALIQTLIRLKEAMYKAPSESRDLPQLIPLTAVSNGAVGDL